MPKGVRLLQWPPKVPPVAIESWSVVTDVPQFIQTTLGVLATDESPNEANKRCVFSDSVDSAKTLLQISELGMASNSKLDELSSTGTAICG
jgi:hypothetical protein